MQIGVLGTGDVGRTLGAGLARRGHRVMIGARLSGSDKAVKWVAETGHGVTEGSFAEAAAFGEVIIVAIGWDNVESALKQADPHNFIGKTVLDAVNPLKPDKDGHRPVLAVGFDDSAGERIQRWLPEAKVVKAFNVIGHMHMVDPDFPEGKPDMFICGNDAGAKTIADGLIHELGWPRAVDLGDITMARYLEPMAMVWITHLFNQGFNPNHAFKLLRK